MTDFINWPYDDVIHAYWVTPRTILAGEYPGHWDSQQAHEKITVLVDNGIRTFIDLTQPTDGLTPYDDTLATVGAERNVELIRVAHPIPDMGVLDIDDYDTILAAVHEATARGGVYIHCWGGVGRTATVVGCLFVESGLSYEGAMRTIKERRAGTRKSHMRAPQTFPQREIIMRRAERR